MAFLFKTDLNNTANRRLLKFMFLHITVSDLLHYMYSLPCLTVCFVFVLLPAFM